VLYNNEVLKMKKPIYCEELDMSKKWVFINNLKLYISNMGDAFRFKNRKINFRKIGKIQTHGYVAVSCLINKKTKQVYLHRLVATYFVSGKTSKRNQINHKNGDRQDNRSENLEWLTPGENNIHAIKTFGRKWSKESRDNQSKAAIIRYRIRAEAEKERIFNIRKELNDCKKRGDFMALVRRHEMSRSALYSIKTKKSWAHI